MASDDDFEHEMTGVQRIAVAKRADLKTSPAKTPGTDARRIAAVTDTSVDGNPLSDTAVEPVGPHDEIGFMRPGVQTGVYKKLRLGKYPIEARLDLHRMKVAQARQEVFSFLQECLRHNVRTVLILHGKGESNPDGRGVLKAYVNKWLRDLSEVMAYHSAQKQHGGTGAVYVLVRKSDEAKRENRELHGLRSYLGSDNRE
jgi:DNA-nicking Smr family endonuclease